MKELAELFDAVYKGFLLRDVFGKIVPGGTFLVAAYVAFVSKSITTPADIMQHFAHLPLSLWGLLVAVGWITGFAIQKVGEWITFRRYYGIWITDDKTWYGMLVHFLNVASPDEKTQFERFVIIQETCGNAAISFIASALVLLIRWHCPATLAPVLLLLACGVVLGFMHRVQANRQTWWLETVLAIRGDRPYRETIGS